MPNFDDNNNPTNSSQSVDSKNSSTEKSSTNNDVNLFDLTKKEDERDIIPAQKTIISEEKLPDINKPGIEQANVIDDSDINEPLPTSRDEAQIGVTPKPPVEDLTPKQNNNIEPQPKIYNSDDQDHIQKNTKKKKLWLITKFILYIIGSFIFVYLFLNFPALWSKLNYNLKEKTGLKPQIQTIIPASTDEELLFLSTVSLYETPLKDEPKKEIKRGPTKDELGLNGIANNEIWIPKLDVRAPIIWDSPVDDATMMENLKHGIVHYKGTTKPGEKAQDGEGNVFVSGHSSYYWWDDGQYKTIFANLDQIEIGDEIGVGYDDYGYIYRVVEKKVVSPDQIDVLNQNTDKNILSVMTCYPVGTNNQRMIVIAEFVARGKDEPEIINEEITPKETSVPVATPTPTFTATPIPISAPDITQTSMPATDIDVINLLPWNW